MTNEADIQAELAKVEQDIANLKAILSGAALAAGLTQLQEKKAALQAQLSGQGLITQASRLSAAERGVAGSAAGGHITTGDHNRLAKTIIEQQTVILAAESFWQRFSPDRTRLAAAELQQATERYLDHLLDRYTYLDFRGMGVSDRVPLRMPLLEMYVPLKARIELPEGETWSRELRLAGRAVSPEEAAAIGQRMSEPQPLLELLGRYDGLIVLGDPGAGKTTFLKYLTLRLARGEWAALALGPRLPILVPLSAYANALAKKDVPLDDFIVRYYRQRGIKLPVETMLAGALEQGGALLLLDGLDEVKNQGRRQVVVDRVVDFFTLQRHRGNKFILTSRIVGYREVRPTVEGLAECTLVDFEEEEITRFVEQWTAALERAARGDTPVAAYEAAREQSGLLAALKHNPGVRHLAANPLLLTILALMKRQGVTLPERRVQLYEQCVTVLLKHWNAARGLGRPPLRDLDVVETVRVLAPLALWMHQTSPGVGLVKQKAVQRKLVEIYTERGFAGPEQAARQLMADAREYASLLLERGPGEYGFIHLTFQEYLAAVAIAQRGQQDIAPVVKALARRIDDDNWHEVSLLAIGYLGIVQQRDEAAGAALQALIEQGPGQAGQAVILAGEAVLDTWPGGVTPRCKEAISKALQTTMVDRQVALPRRAGAGRILGRLGDPREGITSLPPLLTPVIRGKFLYGENKVERETEPFRAGLYPVTNAQFAPFIAAGGYDNQQWWGKEGWQVRQRYGLTQPELWENNRWNIPNHPVVGVTWYEAEAFCIWLTAQFKIEFRLPTAEEWERLARGQHGREYPWGNSWQAGAANSEEGEIGQTSAVGLFPAGVSPCGAYDCAGNVWEWCLDWSDDKKRYKILRGGAYYTDQKRCRCAARYYYGPDFRFRRLGFRVVASPFTSDL